MLPQPPDVGLASGVAVVEGSDTTGWPVRRPSLRLWGMLPSHPSPDSIRIYREGKKEEDLVR